MSYSTNKQPKLNIISKALGLALLLPVGASAATDPNFPVFGETEAFLNHSKSSVPGKNIIPNPAFDLCGADVEAEVYTLTASGTDVLKGDCTKDIMWSWKGFIKGGGGKPQDSSYTAPTGVSLTAPYKGISRNNSTAELRTTLDVTSVDKLYIQFEYQTLNTVGDSYLPQVILSLDSGDIVLETLPSKSTANKWILSNFIHEFTEAYTGKVNLKFVSNGVSNNDKTLIENVFISTEAIINPPPADSDRDQDGYSNDEEEAAGSDPDNAASTPLDFDGDGFSNEEETAAGSDPRDELNTPDSDDADKDQDGVLNGSDKFKDNPDASMDSDDDGYPDEYNAACDEACQEASVLILDATTMVDRYEAYLDVDEDGKPESFIVAECKEGGVIEGADLPLCNGLELDTDFDSDLDGYDDAAEEIAGSDPLNPDSTPLDIDGDGWANDVDGSPMVNTYHLGKDQLTNILDAYAGDAENAELVAKGAGPVGVQWEMFENGGVEKGFELSIVEVEDHDGELTKAFRLYNATAEGNNKNIQLRSEKIVPVAIGTKLGRISGWVKISAPDGIIPTKVGARAVTKGNGVTNYDGKYFLDFAEGGKDQKYLNTDWYYFEADIDNKGEVIEEFQVQLITDKTEGIEVLFDDLEFNLVTPADLDNDEIDNAIDRDDDNDGELDGVDLTPLGDNANDNDQDGILNGYDDDLDNDSIANPMDSAINPVVIDVTKAVADSTTTLTAVTYYEGEEFVNYSWTLNGTEIAESGGVLVIEHEDPNYIGRTFEVLTKAIAGDNGSADYSSTITIEGTVVNQPPEAEFTSSKDENGNVTVSALINEKDGDPVTYTWFVDGNEVDNTELSLMLKFADYQPGQEIKIDLVFSDGVNEPVTITETFQLNSAPFVIFNPEGEADETGFEVDIEERTTKVTIDVDDMDGDKVEITWYANGFPLTSSDGENLTGKSVTLNHTDYLNGSVVELEIHVTDGIGNAVHFINVQLPEAAETDELYPEGKGGSTWWLLTIIMAGLTGRRLKK